MRILLPILGGLVLVSGVISASLWHKLDAERELTADLTKQLKEATSRARAPDSPPALPLGAPMPPPVTTTSAPAAATSPANATVAGRALAMASSSAALQNVITTEAEMWKDPEYRKARLAQARTNIRRQYADMAEEMGLTEAEASKVMDLLAEYQVNLNAEMSQLTLNARNDPAAQQDMMRRQLDSQRERDNALTAVLGPRFTQFQQYQQSLPARSRVSSMNNTLLQAGAPLTSAQTKSLTAVMVTEQQRQQQDLQALTRNVNPQDPEATARITEQLQARNAETNRRVLEAAAPILSAQQLSALRTEFEQQEAITRASSRIRARAAQGQ